MSINTIVGKKCGNCQNIIFPVRLFCNNCRSTDLSDYNLPLKGKIYSFTTVHYPLSHYNNPPYYVGLISFDNDDTIITARIELGNKEKIEIDQEVELKVTSFPESDSLPIILAKIL